MSRSRDVHRAYAIAKFRCPRRHPLPGRAGRTDPGGTASPEYWTTDGIERVDAPDGTTKLRMRCAKCVAEGRGSDLQASWERRVIPFLDELHRRGTRGVATFDL